MFWLFGAIFGGALGGTVSPRKDNDSVYLTHVLLSGAAGMALGMLTDKYYSDKIKAAMQTSGYGSTRYAWVQR